MAEKRAEDQPIKKTNRRMLLCHQFPRCFHNLRDMKAYLLKIKRLGYTHVWISPIQATEDIASYTHIKKGMGSLPKNLYVNDLTIGTLLWRSLYAMKDHENFAAFISSSNKEQDEVDIRAYTKFADDLGLIIMFDLVVNHISKESSLKTNPETKEWFHKPEYMPFGSDCAYFDWENHRVKPAIMGFWKTFITRYIWDYGFHGVRVDAVKHILPDVQVELYQHIYDVSWKKHGGDNNPNYVPTIFAECALDPRKKETAEWLRDNVLCVRDRNGNCPNDYITNITNPLHYKVLTHSFRVEWYRGRGRDRDVFAAKAVRDHMEVLSSIAPTIGFPGCHDKHSLHDSVVGKTRIMSEELGCSADELRNNPQEFTRLFEIKMKERIAMIALMSTGGWYLVSGDEFGLPGRRLVWREHNLRQTFRRRWGASDDYDFRDFICQINHLLGELPEPTEHFWADSIYFSTYPNLIIQALHHDASLKDGTTVVFINLESFPVTLYEHNITKMMGILSSSHKVDPESKVACFLQAMQNPKRFYIIGNVALKGLNQYKPTKIIDSYRERKQKYPDSLLGLSFEEDKLSDEEDEPSQPKLMP